jgi:hypothetical protein
MCNELVLIRPFFLCAKKGIPLRLELLLLVLGHCPAEYLEILSPQITTYMVDQDPTVQSRHARTRPAHQRCPLARRCN